MPYGILDNKKICNLSKAIEGFDRPLDVIFVINVKTEIVSQDITNFVWEYFGDIKFSEFTDVEILMTFVLPVIEKYVVAFGYLPQCEEYLKTFKDCYIYGL